MHDLLRIIGIGEMDYPIPRCGALLREAKAKGLVLCAAPVYADGRERKLPVVLTHAGEAYLGAQFRPEIWQCGGTRTPARGANE